MKKESKLDRLYGEFESEYSMKSDKEMGEIITSLEKEIKGKETTIEKLDEEDGKKISQDLERKRQRLENLKGYSKNKAQIEGIKKYKKSAEERLEKMVAIRDKSLESYKVAKKSYAEIVEKLKDEKYTMTLNQYQYNDLLESKANLEQEINKHSLEYKKAEDKIIILKSQIGKCDLAWKTLFTNKDWDEIQRRATSPNGRFTRKINREKDIPISAKKRQEKSLPTSSEELKIQEELGKKVSKILDEKHNTKNLKNNESTALVERKNGFFRNILNKLRNWINGTKESNEISSGKVENTDERDAFLEGLRQHVDVEYRNMVKGEKDAKYREAHKIPNNREQKQDEGREPNDD